MSLGRCPSKLPATWEGWRDQPPVRACTVVNRASASERREDAASVGVTPSKELCVCVFACVCVKKARLLLGVDDEVS